MRVAMGLAVEGTIGFYGRATAIGWEACEEIERVRAEVLRQRGFASGTSREQVHASRDAGGLDHRHAYQHSCAVLLDEIERVLAGPVNAPSRIAVDAHLRATCVRWGWTGAGDYREWWPQHLEHVLSEDMIGEAWLLARLRSGVRTVSGGERTWLREEEGPPLWEADERPEWRAQEPGPCRVRVGVARTGGVAVRATAAHGGCEFTMRTRRVAAAGIRTWADVTHEGGQWLTWAEAQRRHESLRDADRVAYDALIGELSESRWEAVRAKWWAVVGTEEWQTWARERDHVMDGRDRTHGDVQGINGVRRTAASLGGWEALVDWGAAWTPTWVSVEHLRSSGRALRAVHRAELEAHKLTPVPASVYERLTEGCEAAAGARALPPIGDGPPRRWKAAVAGRVRMTGGGEGREGSGV